MTALTQTFTATSNAAIYNQGVQEPLFAKVLIWRRQTVRTHKPLEKLQHTAGKSWCLHPQKKLPAWVISPITPDSGAVPVCWPATHHHRSQSSSLTSCFAVEKWRWFSHLGTSLEHWSHCLDQDIQVPCQSSILNCQTCIHLKRNSTSSCKSPGSGGSSWGSEGLRFEGHPEEPRQPPAWSLHAGLEGQSKRLRVSAGKQVLADGTTGRD